MRLILLALLFLLNSCYIFTGYKKGSFTYQVHEQRQSFPLIIPVGYSQPIINTDSSGNKEQLYHYNGNGYLYFVHELSPKEYQPIAEEKNIPVQHPLGGMLYKGMDKNGLYWSEIRTDHFKFGYRNIRPGFELRFDSALNFAGYQSFR